MDTKVISDVFGKLDNNVFLIERAFSVKVTNREGYLNISGESENAQNAKHALEKLITMAKNGDVITDQSVNYIIGSIGHNHFGEIDKLGENVICLTAHGKRIVPKTVNQKKYVEKINKNTIVFGVGPAGTGKTYLAMAMAITAFKESNVSRIILTRPAIEAGENLGFLPGDLQQKIDPYLRPLYDALHEIMGQEAYIKNKEKGLIEVAPLAYMRGRTLNNAFIVLDEAQNTTPEQMKMFLTRIGFGSKAIITGDITQIDLPQGKRSGLVEAVNILNHIEDIGIIYLKKEDVVRHPLVQKIISAYEKTEKKPVSRGEKRANLRSK
ncbi:MAG: PhoH family protein [Defluviitaleaceae bacterium]|nr:PhoH family protein [Defluviitaleaceae bacterium]